MKLGTHLWLGDIARACRTIAPGDSDQDRATQQAILALLGFRGSEHADLAPMPAGVDPAPTMQREAIERKAQAVELEGEMRAEQEKLAPTPVTARLRPLAPRSRMPVAPPANWSEGIPTLPLKSPPAPPLPHEPLTAPGKSRELISASVMVRERVGALDIARLVDVISQGRAVTRLFRQPRWTLRRGAQVLLDLGEGTEPFRDDQFWLVEQLARFVGREQLEVLRFYGSPSRRVQPTGTPRSVPYRPPPERTPVLVLSDLGIAGRYGVCPLEHAWREWSEGLRRRGSPVLVLLPYPPSRWPQVPRAMKLAAWNRGLNLGALRRARRYSR